MAAKCMVALLGGDLKSNELPDTVPEPIRDFLLGFLVQAVEKRTLCAAWDAHDKFDKILLDILGKHSYRPFKIPGDTIRIEVEKSR
jgi:hypothetical protein